MSTLTARFSKQAPPRARVAPGPRGLPLLGHSVQLLRDNLGFAVEMARRYGDVVQYRMGPMPVYQVNHPEGVQHILQDNTHNYDKGTWQFPFFRMLVGNGLILSEGDFWLRQRRLMQPVFHRQSLAAFGEIMARTTLEMIRRWDGLAKEDQPLDMAGEMRRLTLEIVTQALFSTPVVDDNQAIGAAMHTIAEDFTFRFLVPFYPPPNFPTLRNRRFRAALATVEGAVTRILQERRQLLDQVGEADLPRDLLSMLLLASDPESGEKMSDQQLRDEAITLFLAGHETTSNALSWVWYLLATHPEVEERLFAEVDDVLGGRAPTPADLPDLPYTRRVIDETLRLYPPAWIANRRCVEEDVIRGYRIPPKTFVAFSAYVIHRHPDYWADPETFDPDRFAPDHHHDRPRFAYFPFGGGPHLCIGRDFALVEAQLILATIAQRIRLRLAPGYQMDPQALLTLRPRGGLPMTLQRRP